LFTKNNYAVYHCCSHSLLYLSLYMVQKTVLHKISSLITRWQTMTFFTQTSDIPLSHSISSNTDTITKNFEILSEHHYMIKNIEEILESRNLILLSVSIYTYWWNICFEKLCLIELIGTSMESWLDGNVVKDSNITDLICNAREKAKAVGKNQFVTSCDEHTFCTDEK